MTQSLFSRQAACLSVACVLLVAGCATKTPPLYYWGDYQKEV